MSGGRRHKHRRPDTQTKTRRLPLPAQRPAARLTGGPLHGCTVHIDRGDADAGTIPAPGGRYVRVDADEWAYETDHIARRP